MAKSRTTPGNVPYRAEDESALCAALQQHVIDFLSEPITRRTDHRPPLHDPDLSRQIYS